jgi:hypothetical protein
MRFYGVIAMIDFLIVATKNFHANYAEKNLKNFSQHF